MLDPMFDSGDYELRWPRPVFARELAALRAESDPAERAARIGLLLEDAFAGSAPARAYQAAADRLRFGGFPEPSPGPFPEPYDAARPPEFLDRLVENLDELAMVSEPRPYWPRRDAPTRAQLDPPAARRRFGAAVTAFERDGFFDRHADRGCVDQSPPVTDLDEVIADRLGVGGLWSPQSASWDTDTFLALVEVLHDLAARPRHRWYHRYNGCGWHFSEFAADTGRALYRWQINQLLDTTELGLRLAETGPDTGRLVAVTDDARADLVEHTLATPDRAAADKVEHAIALFRRRGAGIEDRRSAVVVLAGVLEQRRALIATEIGKPDEGALFGIANNFAVRHQRRDQHGDYDPAFLDWMFWWYLATVELTDRILTRQTASTSPTATTGTLGSL